MEIEDGAATLLGNHAHGLVENLAAMAIRSKHITRGTAGVHAHQNCMGARGPGGARVTGDVRRPFVAGRATGAQVAANEGNMAFAAVDLALISDHAEFAVFGLKAGFPGANDVALMAQAVANKFGHGENAELVLSAERDQVWNAGHLAIVAHNFADNAGRLKAGQAGEVHGGFRLPGANQNASLPGTQREDVARANEIGSCGFGVDGRTDGVSAVGGGNAGSNAFAGFNGLREGGAEAGRILLRHRKEPQIICSFFSQRKADKSSPIAGHEVDSFGSDVLRRERQVAFVLAVFVVNNHHHAAGADFRNGARDVGERGLEGAFALGHRNSFHSRRLGALGQRRYFRTTETPPEGGVSVDSPRS